MSSASQEHIKYLQILSFFGICPFSINNTQAMPNQLKLFTSMLTNFIVAIVLMPILSYKTLLNIIRILTISRNSAIFNYGTFTYFATRFTLPAITILTYFLIGFFSIHKRSYHIYLINKMFKINNNVATLSNQHLFRKSICIVFGYVILLTVLILIKLRQFDILLLYIIFENFIKLIYLLEISYIHYVSVMIARKFNQLLLMHYCFHDVTDVWSKLKYLYEKTFSEIFLVNGFFDFTTLTVQLYEITFYITVGHHKEYFRLFYKLFSYVIVYGLKSVLLVKSVNGISEKVIFCFTIR